MSEQVHAVRRIELVARIADEEQALALLARVEEFGRDRALAVMERLFDELVPAERHLRLQRLDLDLGVLPVEGFEAAAAEALERALREALPEILDAAAPRQAERRELSEGEARLAVLEHYLLHGTVPFWAGAQSFAFPALLEEAAQAQPVQLGALLRRIVGSRYALERLVLQAGEDALRRLLGALAPADAALILAYLTELVLVHRVEPFVPLEESALKRLLWLLTFEYLLREAGSQFNRRSFLGTLLADLAESEDISYADLLRLLRDALLRAERKLALRSSLPATLRELLAEENLPEEGAPALAPAAGASAAALAALLARRAPEAELRAALQRNAADRRALARLARALSASQFCELVARTAPDQARDVQTTLDAFLARYAKTLSAIFSRAGLEQVLRLSTLAQLARGTRLDADEHLETLMRDLAADAGLRFAELLQFLAAAPSPAIAAPGIERRIADLARAAPPPGGATNRADAQAPLLLADFERALRWESARPDRIAALTQRLAGLAPSDLADLVRRFARERATLRKLVALLDRRALEAVLDVLDRDHAGEVVAYLETLWQMHRAEPLLPLGEARFEEYTWTLALDYVAREPGSQFNRRSLLRSLIQGIAAHDGLDEGDILAALARGLAVLRARRVSTGSLPAVLAELLDDVKPAPARGDAALAQLEQFLRTGRASETPAHLLAEARRHPESFAALLRKLAGGDARQWRAALARVLDEFAPQDVLDILVPGTAGEEAAEALADLRRIGMSEAWFAILGAAATGEALPDAMRVRPGRRLDREDALRHWLDRGALPWWAPEDLPASALAAELRARSLAELIDLFVDRDTRLARLRRVRALLGSAEARTLFERLAHHFADDEGFATLLASDANTDAPRSEESSGATAKPAHHPGRDAALAWLGGEDDGGAQADYAAVLADLADAQDAGLRAALLENWRDPAVQARWIAALPDRVLARLLYLIAPSHARHLLDTARLLHTAWRQIAPPEQRPLQWRLPWSALFVALSNREPARFSPRELAHKLALSLVGEDCEIESRLLEQAQHLARESGALELVSALQAPSARSSARSRKADTRRGRKRFSLAGAEDEAPESDPVYVRNAGLVLFNPFLPRFFQELDVLREGPDGKPRITDPDAAARAVHLLQYLVDERADRPEPDLLLNKILCGLDTLLPVAPGIEPTEKERELCAQMIAAVLSNWTTIKNTSPAGLRETFLAREGRLTRGDNGWSLFIQRKTVDVLVDQVPWQLGVVYHRWMGAPLNVTW